VRSGPQRCEYEAIVERIARDRPRRILDWGCGFGLMTMLLRERGLDVVAYDYRSDAPGERVAPLEHFPEIHAHISSDPVRLPFPASSFHAVLSSGVLEHVADPDASLDELRRVLAPGGVLYVYKLPNRYSYLERLAKGLGMYYHGAEPGDAVYTRRSATRLLRAHGFEVGHCRRANMLPLTLEGRLAQRLAGPIWAANRALSRVPGLNMLATNLEVVATAPR
jgi:ubiquinone/menaquinone biosynthesis C-methylase UbiE